MSEELRAPFGSISLRMRLFDTPEEELRACMHPPWPRWMRRLYGLESKERPAVDPEEGEVTASAALSALKARLAHRLELLSWICGALEDQGWQIQLQDDHLVATRTAVPEHAREQLDAAGIAGPLLAVCELDERGWPRLYESWEVPRP